MPVHSHLTTTDLASSALLLRYWSKQRNVSRDLPGGGATNFQHVSRCWHSLLRNASRDTLAHTPRATHFPGEAIMSEDFAKPHHVTLAKWLKCAVAAGLVQIEGTGRKADPYRY
jgi:hypothetical protein